MKRTGELLRKAREEKGLSVHEVSMFLKINTRILQAIEEGNQANLPAKTFLRGFVQSYAKFLKIDVQEVLQVFTEEMSPHPISTPDMNDSSTVVASDASSEGPKLEIVASKPTTSDPVAGTEVSSAEEDPFKNSVLAKASQPPDTLRIRTIAISLISLLLVFIIYFANSVIKKYQREAELAPDMVASLPIANNTMSAVEPPSTANADETQSTPTSNETTPSTSASNEKEEHTSTSTTPVSPSANTVGSSIPTPTSAPALKPQASAGILSSPAPTPVPQVAAKPAATPAPAAPTPTPKPTTVTTSPSTPTAAGSTTADTARPNSAAETAAPKPPSSEGKLVEVIIEARQNVEIEYSSAKSRPQRLSLKGDQIHTFKSRSGVRLRISNGGAVNVIVNGRDLGVPGVVGQPVQLAYD